ncbi:MAG TPA: hypothetical protein DCY12_11455 [Candidatus Atribacteria bacterium]|nr:hypothetical protein [Candidatus Atribacteria bacterium]
MFTMKLLKVKNHFMGKGKNTRGWDSGTNLEECRKNLRDTIEGWIILSIKKNFLFQNWEISA